MRTFVVTDTGRVLEVVTGRDCTSLVARLSAHNAQWREGVEVVAIDPSAAFGRALREHLPHVAVSVDGSTS